MGLYADLGRIEWFMGSTEDRQIQKKGIQKRRQPRVWDCIPGDVIPRHRRTAGLRMKTSQSKNFNSPDSFPLCSVIRECKKGKKTSKKRQKNSKKTSKKQQILTHFWPIFGFFLSFLGHGWSRMGVFRTRPPESICDRISKKKMKKVEMSVADLLPGITD